MRIRKTEFGCNNMEAFMARIASARREGAEVRIRPYTRERTSDGRVFFMYHATIKYYG